MVVFSADGGTDAAPRSAYESDGKTWLCAGAGIIAASTPAIVVPTSSIVSFAGVEKVLTVAGGKVVERRVELGRREGTSVEILKGLTPGESVIVEPGNLVDGETVRVTP